MTDIPVQDRHRNRLPTIIAPTLTEAMVIVSRQFNRSRWIATLLSA